MDYESTKTEKIMFAIGHKKRLFAETNVSVSDIITLQSSWPGFWGATPTLLHQFG